MSGMPLTWAPTKVGVLFEFCYGKALPKTGRSNHGTIPVYGSNGVTGFHDQALVNKPCILVGRKGAAGRVSKATHGCWPIDTTYYVEVPEGLDFEFCFHLFHFQRFEKFEKSTAIPSLSRDDAYEQEIVIPPLTEQRRIVAKVEALFSKLEAGVAALKQARAQLAVYRQALLRDAFEGRLTADWRSKHSISVKTDVQLLAQVAAERDQAFERELAEWKAVVADWDHQTDGEKAPPKPQKLKPATRDDRPKTNSPLPSGWKIFHLDQIAISIGQGWSPKCESIPAKGNQWSVMKTTAIQPLEFRGRENKLLPSHLYPRPWLRIAADDILITRAGPRSRCSIVCRVGDAPENLMLCDKAYRLRFSKSVVLPAFIELLLNSSDASNRIEALKTGINDSGVNITQTGFLNLAFAIPPFDEQCRIQQLLGNAMSIVSALETDIDVNLAEAEALRQAILKKAFAGELVPQDPADEPAAALLARIQAERDTSAAAKASLKPPKKSGRFAKA